MARVGNDHEHDDSDKHDKHGTEESGHKKLISGKCAKADEYDIKIVVKYTHEKLDSRHVKDKKFDELDFNLLIAGELEIADLLVVESLERKERVQIAKTLCYHKNYLNDNDLREGYDTIMKQVEQGKITWGDNLAGRLHEHLDYRANVIMRNKIAQQERSSKVEPKKATPDRNPTGPENTTKERIIYCLEYNQGSCPHADNHEGRFNNKKVVKFHICRRCHREGEFRSHRELDNVCPKKWS